VMARDVRCPTPSCRKKFAHDLDGRVEATCPRCKVRFEIVRQEGKLDTVRIRPLSS
jgi:phage FluMu protein Com